MSSSTTATGCKSMCVTGVCACSRRTATTDRYSRIVEEAARIKGAAILDAEVVCLDEKGVPQFDTLHSRAADQSAVACAFDC
jgi:ATP-dependent DNA ligase